MRRLPVVEHGSLSADGKRRMIYPADVHGRFARARRWTFAILIAVYVALPWIPVGGHPAVQLDVVHRSFYLFGAVFNAQDLWMMVFLVTGAFFTLVVATALVGRVFCGWVCPQTVWIEAVFRPIERLLQGPREARLKREAAGPSWDRFWRKGMTHALYAAVALLLAHVFLAYFVSLPELFRMVRGAPSEHPGAFLLVFGFAGILYFDFAWFREQFCVVLCPYGRLQSTLLDPDSIVIGYDRKRGEPRGKATQTAAGDCVDCKRCVVVCPTGIDIREGLQMDCVSCTACIDACDEIMDKLGRKRGLVRYDSQRGLAHEPRRTLRPRVYVYAVLLTLGIGAASFAFGRRVDFEANLLRLPGAPYVLEGESVRNALAIHLVNKRSKLTEFTVRARPIEGAVFTIAMPEVHLEPLASFELPIFVTMPRSLGVGRIPLTFEVTPRGGATRLVEGTFLGPDVAAALAHGERR